MGDGVACRAACFGNDAARVPGAAAAKEIRGVGAALEKKTIDDGVGPDSQRDEGGWCGATGLGWFGSGRCLRLVGLSQVNVDH